MHKKNENVNQKYKNVDNVDNFCKSYPHKKPSKIKGFKKLSTIENELSTSYPQFFTCQKYKKVIHNGSYPQFVDNSKIYVKKSSYNLKMWIMWITFHKSYPHKKPSKIKGFKKLSTIENELSTSYPHKNGKLSTIENTNFFIHNECG